MECMKKVFQKIEMFAITRKKAGWDCLRHYEILANGCIPLFLNIENCPKNILSLFPKNIILETNKFYYSISNKNITDLTREEITQYNKYKNLLFEYTRNNLTTISISKYILNKNNLDKCNNILFLSGNTNPDYLRCLTLHGFKSLFKNKCHDYPKIRHLYKNENIDYQNLYGRGMTYTNLLDQSYHDDIKNLTIEIDIKQKKYDLIIYGSLHRGLPFYDLVNKTYSKNEIILLCGEDTHICDLSKFKNHNIFLREYDKFIT